MVITRDHRHSDKQRYLYSFGVLRKGTWDALPSGTVTVIVSDTTDILTVAGPIWIITAQLRIYGNAIVRTHCRPILRIDTNHVMPHRYLQFRYLVDDWGLDNGMKRVKILLDDTTANNYVLYYDFSDAPIWVPNGSTFKVSVFNGHGSTAVTGRGALETVSEL